MEIINLYHGSYTRVSQIDFSKCYRGLDFGKGFYATTSKIQAIKFIPTAIGKAIKNGTVPKSFNVSDGVLSKYSFIKDPLLKILEFKDAGLDWLHFVAAHRNGTLFPEIVEKYADYDLIIGKIADDQTASTLAAYTSGAYGVPGEKETDDFVIRKLLPNKLKDQYCIRTAKAAACLKFIGSELYEKAKYSTR